MNYHEALLWLDAHYNVEATLHGWARNQPTLDRIRVLVHALGDPQRHLPAIHITGTNGKGSTSRIAAAVLEQHGLSIGLVTSPHLHRVEERIMVNGQPISTEGIAEVLAAVRKAEEASGVSATYFEVLAAAALLWFRWCDIDIAVVEVGVGGRFDATNVVDGQVAVVTNVQLDHTDVLGTTRADIAHEKSGIVKPGATLVLGETDASLAPLFANTPAGICWRAGDHFSAEGMATPSGRRVRLKTPGFPADDVELQVHGEFQDANTACGVAAADAFLNSRLDGAAVQRALAGVTHPCRFEIVRTRPLVVIDGAHNPAGAHAATAARRQIHTEDFLLVVGIGGGRDIETMLAALDVTSARHVLSCSASWGKPVDADHLSQAAARLGARAVAAPSVEAAVQQALALARGDDLVFVAGSLYCAAEAAIALGHL